SVDRRENSLDRSRPEDPTTSTPIRSRSRNGSTSRDDCRASSVPLPKKAPSRALFTTSTPKPSDRKHPVESLELDDVLEEVKPPVHNRVFDDEMEKSRPSYAEVDAAAERRAISQAPSEIIGNISMTDSQTGGDRSLNDTRLTWGAESCISIASIRTTRGGEKKTGTNAKIAAAARAYWTDLLKCQRDWYIKVTTTPFSSKSASTHVLDAYTELKSSLCSFSPKPDELVRAMELFAVHNTRLYMFLTSRGIPDSATALAEFVHAVLTKFLSNPTQMQEIGRAWQLAKHIVELMIVVPTSIDILLSIKSTITQIQTEFIRTWTACHSERDLRFISYAIKCLDGLSSVLTVKINLIVSGIAFGYGGEE
ncbi:hypothetical protein PENTCL1PPCAC_18210, partial [Pristionchus entomophagus]